MSPVCLTPRARELRAEATRAERLFWWALRNRQLGGWKWRRQVPRGPFVVDFLCVDAELVVELDGGQHADAEDYDARRTAWLKKQGLRVIRFWNIEVTEHLDGVCDAILAACGGERSPSPRSLRESPSPRRGEGL